ncbi:hypothetical protein Tco_1135100 [Tanacetum coccineum]
MQGIDLSKQERNSRIMNEFDKFSAKAGESLTSVYERFSTLVNNMDRNKIKPNEIALNTKFLNSLQPEWGKYVTLTRQSHTLSKEHFNKLYDYLSQCEPHVNASRAKQNARNHEPLALVANSYTNHSYSHARMQGGQLRIKPLMLEMVLHKRMWKNKENAQGFLETMSTSGKTNVQCYNYNEKGHYARDYLKPRVRDAKYFREQMLLTGNDKAEVNLDTEENDFMLMNTYGDDQLEELNALVIMMALIQPTDNKFDVELTYDAEIINKVNASQIDLINGLLLDVEAENQRRINNELKNQNGLIQRELETCKERVWDFEKKPVQFINYKSGYEKAAKSNKLGYQNLERLKKSIQAQPKMFYGKYHKCDNSSINLPDFKETLEDAEESQLKMKDKMIQIDYAKLNKLYDSFVPQMVSADQTYLSPPSTSNVTPESSPQKSSLPPKEMPKAS